MSCVVIRAGMRDHPPCSAQRALLEIAMPRRLEPAACLEIQVNGVARGSRSENSTGLADSRLHGDCERKAPSGNPRAHSVIRGVTSLLKSWQCSPWRDSLAKGSSKPRSSGYAIFAPEVSPNQPPNVSASLRRSAVSECRDMWTLPAIQSFDLRAPHLSLVLPRAFWSRS